MKFLCAILFTYNKILLVYKPNQLNQMVNIHIFKFGKETTEDICVIGQIEALDFIALSPYC